MTKRQVGRNLSWHTARQKIFSYHWICTQNLLSLSSSWWSLHATPVLSSDKRLINLCQFVASTWSRFCSRFVPLCVRRLCHDGVNVPFEVLRFAPALAEELGQQQGPVQSVQTGWWHGITDDASGGSLRTKIARDRHLAGVHKSGPMSRLLFSPRLAKCEMFSCSRRTHTAKWWIKIMFSSFLIAFALLGWKLRRRISFQDILKMNLFRTSCANFRFALDFPGRLSRRLTGPFRGSNTIDNTRGGGTPHTDGDSRRRRPNDECVLSCCCGVTAVECLQNFDHPLSPLPEHGLNHTLTADDDDGDDSLMGTEGCLGVKKTGNFET